MLKSLSHFQQINKKYSLFKKKLKFINHKIQISKLLKIKKFALKFKIILLNNKLKNNLNNFYNDIRNFHYKKYIELNYFLFKMKIKKFIFMVELI